MSASFYDLLKYAKTGIDAHDTTNFDKMRALSMASGGSIKTLTGVPPLSFRANGKPLISWSIYGNGQQQGTPTPDNPIMPEFVGVNENGNWTIPITCAGQTVPVYLGQTQTVRKIHKFVLDGTEEWKWRTGEPLNVFFIEMYINPKVVDNCGLCTHYLNKDSGGFDTLENKHLLIKKSADGIRSFIGIRDSNFESAAELKSYLEDQYAAGTPVTVWCVLATPETGIINEPLCKIGAYADELHSADAGVMIPTTRGQNVLTVGTDLQPSSVSITGYIKPT